jgi:hypothetical protein
MPLAGKGMLITWMDIDAADDADFNLWYDREHLAERVGIEGFLEARRWTAETAPTRYFCTYSTETFEVLDSPAYKKVLDNQTDWSKRNIARFRTPGRVLGRITISRGEGRGAALGVVRMRPDAAGRDALRERLHEALDPGMLPGIISMHLVEGDAELSKPLTKPVEPNPGAGDWYVLIEATSVAGVADVIADRFSSARAGAPIVSTGTYKLMWDLSRSDLNRR